MWWVRRTRNEDGVESQGNDSPEVIPPEHPLLETEGNPGDGDKTRHEEETQGGICSAQRSVSAKRSRMRRTHT